MCVSKSAGAFWSFEVQSLNALVNFRVSVRFRLAYRSALGSRCSKPAGKLGDCTLLWLPVAFDGSQQVSIGFSRFQSLSIVSIVCAYHNWHSSECSSALTTDACRHSVHKLLLLDNFVNLIDRRQSVQIVGSFVFAFCGTAVAESLLLLGYYC